MCVGPLSPGGANDALREIAGGERATPQVAEMIGPAGLNAMPDSTFCEITGRKRFRQCIFCGRGVRATGERIRALSGSAWEFVRMLLVCTNTHSRRAGIGVRTLALGALILERLQVAALGLLAFERYEERLEVALAEPAAAMALDQFKKQRRAILHRRGEDLKQVAVLVAIDQDAQLLQL